MAEIQQDISGQLIFQSVHYLYLLNKLDIWKWNSKLQ